MQQQKPLYGGVLCAGFGSRLRPLTDILPKPLLPFLNTPLVTYAFDHLARLGIQRVGVNLHHLADTIPPVVDRICAPFGIHPVYTREWEILGTAGGVRGLWTALGEEPCTLVVLNGDAVTNIDLAAHLEYHYASNAMATIVVRPRVNDQPGRVWLDEDMQLQGLRDMRHPDSPKNNALTEYDFTGVHIIDSSLLDTIPMEFGCLVGDVYGPMLERGDRINVSIMDDFWAALDTPELFLSTTRQILANPGLFKQAPIPGTSNNGYFICSPEHMNDQAQLGAPIFTGLHVQVAPGAHIGPNVVLDGVEVHSDARIENAILYGMGALEGHWKNCIAVAGKVLQLPEPN